MAAATSALVRAIAAAGYLDRARPLLDHAEALARSITEPLRQADALAELAKVITAAGDLDRAETLARSIADPRAQAEALAALAKAAAVAGDPDRAEALVRSMTEP